MQNKQAFTLIELLVVVLIIGILAAVALPQYQLAVTKSRVSTILPTLQSMAKAQEMYYLDNAAYTNIGYNLDITMPPNCTPLPQSYGQLWTCGTDWLIDLGAKSNNVVAANYCPGYQTQTLSQCVAKRDFQIYFTVSNHTTPNTIRCTVYHSSSLGKKICSTMFPDNQ